eukprot:bmy_06783T0
MKYKEKHALPFIIRPSLKANQKSLLCSFVTIAFKMYLVLENDNKFVVSPQEHRILIGISVIILIQNTVKMT